MYFIVFLFHIGRKLFGIPRLLKSTPGRKIHKIHKILEFFNIKFCEIICDCCALSYELKIN